MKQYLETAKIVATHGIRGEVRCQYFCDSAEFLCEFDELYLDKNGEKPVEIARAYPHKNVVIMKIEGIDTVEDAQKLIGKTLYMNRDDVELDEDVYFIQDIIGLVVKDIDSGEVYGKISEVYQNGATDVYSIKKENGRELMFPYIDEVVKKIDIDAGEMLIKPLEGLFDED
ncbi:MAG: ribosome maturation factor RimM [Oscillospiraceae bacterium]